MSECERGEQHRDHFCDEDDDDESKGFSNSLHYNANARFSTSSSKSRPAKNKKQSSKNSSSNVSGTSSSRGNGNSKRQQNNAEEIDSNGVPVKYSFVFGTNEYKMITENHLQHSLTHSNDNHKYYKAVCYFFEDLDETFQHTGNIRNVTAKRIPIPKRNVITSNSSHDMFNHMKSVLYKLIPLAIGMSDETCFLLFNYKQHFNISFTNERISLYNTLYIHLFSIR